MITNKSGPQTGQISSGTILFLRASYFLFDEYDHQAEILNWRWNMNDESKDETLPTEVDEDGFEVESEDTDEEVDTDDDEVTDSPAN